ncbi:hypothetical protein RRG08_058977 [Elysia crispata]|uniref:Uncharacterized protein n=1 Tax=Elysia crispata TaxID=231223 RepID=A0AAE1AXF4_9GAST|nr:hypothetical protein RRG08_058977 [Elysia crispata]
MVQSSPQSTLDSTGENHLLELGKDEGDCAYIIAGSNRWEGKLERISTHANSMVLRALEAGFMFMYILPPAFTDVKESKNVF